MHIRMGIIGGSGLENSTLLHDPQDLPHSTTPYGDTSSPLHTGRIGDTIVFFLARHGREHTIPPGKVNYRANIHALKHHGCTHILASTAVGSLKEDIRPGDLVVIDQFIDFTKQRAMSFAEAFEPHSPIHCPMATPFDGALRHALIASCQQRAFAYHATGTVITIEGPRFSTHAESKMFRSWGADIINMSTATEAALANEAGISYAAIAMSTDYDCWKTNVEPVSWEAVHAVFQSNAEKVRHVLCDTVQQVGQKTAHTERI